MDRGADRASADGRIARTVVAGDQQNDAIAVRDRPVQFTVDRSPSAVERHSVEIDDPIGLDAAASEPLVPTAVEG